jgi:hypothetical protein
MTKRVLMNHSLSPVQAGELFIHLSLFLGYPVMLDGLERVSPHLLGHRRTSISARRQDDHSKGLALLKRIYGGQTRKLLVYLDSLHPGLGVHITRNAYGSIMRRRALSLGDREIVNVAVLLVLGFDRQLYSHIRGALRAGVSPGAMRSSIALSARMTRRSPSIACKLMIEIQKSRRGRAQF